MAKTVIPGTQISDGSIFNVDVNTAAAIDGTKISPDFGAQNLIVDTDTLYVNATSNFVGIGVSPSYPLHIVSPESLITLSRSSATSGVVQTTLDWNAVNTSDYYLNFTQDSNVHGRIIGRSSANGNGIHIAGGGGGSTAIQISYANRVGIGQTADGAHKLAVSGDITVTGVYRVSGAQISLSSLSDGSDATLKSTLTTAGDIYYASAISTPARLGVGADGQVLTLAAGLPTWATPSGGGTPAGSNTQIQFNNSGAFGADASFVWDNTNKSLLIGPLAQPAPIAGLGIFQLSAPTDSTPAIIAIATGDADPAFVGVRVGGTTGSPLATPSGATLVNVGGHGADDPGGGVVPNFENDGGGLDLSTTQQWSTTAHGTKINLSVVPKNSVTTVQALAVTAVKGQTVACTFQFGADTVTLNDHGHFDGDRVSFRIITTTTGINVETDYYVVNSTTNTFQIEASQGGGAIDLLTADGTGEIYTRYQGRLIVGSDGNLASSTLSVNGSMDVKVVQVSISETHDAGNESVIECVPQGSEVVVNLPAIAPTTACTFQDTGDTVTQVAHGLADDDFVFFATIVTTTGISTDTQYYVISATANTFQVSASEGGGAIVLTGNGTGTITGDFLHGRIYTITKSDNFSTGQVTIIPYGNESISNASSYVLTGKFESVTLISTPGSAWIVLAHTENDPFNRIVTDSDAVVVDFGEVVSI